MFKSASLLAGISVAQLAQEQDFLQYIAKHNKNYASMEEYALRHSRLLRAELYIIKNNSDPESTHRAGHNFLSDLMEEEFEKMMGLTG
jgi:hypothetical protein